MPIQFIPVILPRRKTQKGKTLVTCWLLLGTLALMSSPAPARQSTAKLFGGEVLHQHLPLLSSGRDCHPNRLIANFKKGGNSQQLIKNIGAERRESCANRSGSSIFKTT